LLYLFNMKNTISILSLVTLMATTGAGCISFSSDNAAGSDGAIWKTEDVGASWTQLDTLPQASGVTSIGGVNVSDLEIDPSDPKTYYLATYANGLFYTYTAGNTWDRPSDSSLRSGTVLQIEVDPKDVCTIYVLTPSYVMKSTDCARNFESMYQIDQTDETLTAMVLDWYDTSTLWVGDTLGTLIKTTDGGKTWATNQRFGKDITDLMISNRDSRIMMVATSSKGMYRTQDAGASWVEYQDVLKKEFRDSDDVYGFTQTADGTSVIMNTKYGLLRSEDNGETWLDIPLITEARDVRIYAIAYDPESSLNIYYATATTFYSTSTAGSSWMTEDLPSTRTPTEIVVHPEDGTVVYAGFASFEE